MSRSRAFGSRSRQRVTSWRTAAGVEAGRASRSSGWWKTAPRVSATLSASNSRRPASISQSRTPKAQMSVRRSIGFPAACSGDMYAAVPRMTPSCVPCAAVRVGEFISVGERARSAAEAEPGVASIALASPKSRTLAFPSLEALMFWGLRSRWTIPLSWASSSACAICSAKERLSVRERGPDSRRSASVGPGTSSMTRACVSPLVSRP